MIDIMRRRLARRLHDWNYGFILDGFPRNDRKPSSSWRGYDIDAVVMLSSALPKWFARVLIQPPAVRPALGSTTTSSTHRPARPDTCDVCGGALESRSDDTPQAIRARLDEYHVQAGPILELFGRKELVVTVDGTRGPDEVHREICRKVGLPLTGTPARSRAESGS